MKQLSEIAIEEIPNAFDPDEILPARAQYLVNIERRGFIYGASYMSNELLRWHDTNVELPDYYSAVLVKYLKDGLYRYAVAWLSVSDNGEYLWTIDETDIIINDGNVHFWRPIM